MSNLNHPGREAFTEGQPLAGLDLAQPRRLPVAACPANAHGAEATPARATAQEMRFAVLSLTAAVAMWALLVSVLATRLQPPSLF